MRRSSSRVISLAAIWFGSVLSSGCSLMDGERDAQNEPGPLAAAAQHQIESGMQARARLVIRTHEEWQATWAQLTSNRGPAPETPKVRFDEYVVLVAATGTRPSGGFTIDITDVGISEDGDAEITVSEVSPGERCVVTAALTEPTSVVLAPWFPGEARWVETARERACR